MESLSDLDVMTATVWGEARGEARVGQVAVAWVIRNRAENPRWWGRNIREVCLKSYQFSCWNPNDPNYKKIISPDLKKEFNYSLIREVCQEVLDADKLQDLSNNADHYCVTSIIHLVKWAKGKTPVALIGHHSFFRLELFAL